MKNIIIIGENSAKDVLVKIFKSLNWTVKAFKFLDLNFENKLEVDVYLFILPTELNNEFFDKLILLRTQCDKTVLVLDNIFSMKRKNKLMNLGIDWYFANPINYFNICKYASFYSLKYEEEHSTINYKDIFLDIAKRSVTRGRQTHYLRNKEFELLKFFLEHTGVILSRSQLLESVWDMNSSLNTTTLETHISSLRKKLDRNFEEKRFHTIYYAGYKFE